MIKLSVYASLIVLLLFSSCSRKNIVNLDISSKSPQINDIFADSTLSMGMISIVDSDFEITKECPAPLDISVDGPYEKDPRGSNTHEALSQSAFEFELNNSLDSLLRFYFPANPRNYLIPGLAVPEGDYRLDSLVLLARKNSYWNFESLKLKSDAINKVKVSQVPNELKRTIKEIYKLYPNDIYILPLDARLVANPKKQCSRSGEFEISVIYTIWHGKSAEAIFVMYSNHKVKVSSEKNNLNQGWTRELIQYLSNQWGSFLNN